MAGGWADCQDGVPVLRSGLDVHPEALKRTPLTPERRDGHYGIDDVRYVGASRSPEINKECRMP